MDVGKIKWADSDADPTEAKKRDGPKILRSIGTVFMREWSEIDSRFNNTKKTTPKLHISYIYNDAMYYSILHMYSILFPCTLYYVVLILFP